MRRTVHILVTAAVSAAMAVGAIGLAHAEEGRRVPAASPSTAAESTIEWYSVGRFPNQAACDAMGLSYVEDGLSTVYMCSRLADGQWELFVDVGGCRICRTGE